MNITSVLSKIFTPRLKELDRFGMCGEEIQKEQLRKLVAAARNTEFGREHHFSEIRSYADFCDRVPVTDYDGIKHSVERMIRGEKNILWPSDVHYFAKSSGTTNDKSKFLPVSRESLKHCHYRGGMDCVSVYFRMNPDSRFFSGKGLILGGSRAVNPFGSDAYCGDLSAILIQNVSPFVNLFRTPDKKTALMGEWESKLDALAEKTISQNITSLSGVPSWFLGLIKHILEKTGKETLTELWPDLEVFFHGGISFAPYREQYQKLIPSPRMHYVETYNASEGFFAVQDDLSDPGMLLLIDLGIFFEFIPMDEVDNDNARPVPIWEVQAGKNYALVITTNSGLWRYRIGDTVRVTSTDPVKIVISGRTKHYINAFGEELMVDNAEQAIAKTTAETGATVLNYTAAPVYMRGNERGRHQWLIEFGVRPQSIDDFALLLDKNLQSLNSDYEAKRYKGLFLDPLEIIPAREGVFDQWLRDRDKLGGQHKIPRLSNNREFIDALLQINH